MTIASLIASPSELTDAASNKTAIVLMTRIRLARNLATQPFPGWAKPAQRTRIAEICTAAVANAFDSSARVASTSLSTNSANSKNKSSSNATSSAASSAAPNKAAA